MPRLSNRIYLKDCAGLAWFPKKIQRIPKKLDGCEVAELTKESTPLAKLFHLKC